MYITLFGFFSFYIIIYLPQQGLPLLSIFQKKNDRTVKDKFLIPIVEELLDELHDAKFFTKLDLRSGYHQVRMPPDNVKKTTF
jgi:hypothetical protein